MNGERFTYKNSKPPWSSKIQNLHDYVSSQSSRAFRGVNPEIRRQDEVEVLELPFCWGKDLSSTQSAVPQERKPGEAVVMWQFCVWNYCWWKKSGEAPGTKRTMYIMGHVHNFTYIYILYIDLPYQPVQGAGFLSSTVSSFACNIFFFDPMVFDGLVDACQKRRSSIFKHWESWFVPCMEWDVRVLISTLDGRDRTMLHIGKQFRTCKAKRNKITTKEQTFDKILNANFLLHFSLASSTLIHWFLLNANTDQENSHLKAGRGEAYQAFYDIFDIAFSFPFHSIDLYLHVLHVSHVCYFCYLHKSR